MMNYAIPTKNPSNWAHWAAVAVLAMAALCPQQALAVSGDIARMSLVRAESFSTQLIRCE